MKEENLARIYLDLRKEGVSFRRIIQKLWGVRALIRLTLILLPGLLYLGTQNIWYLLICSVFFGATVETLSYYYKTYKLWTFTERIINWEEMKRIAGDSGS